jgi:hypothetical protein
MMDATTKRLAYLARRHAGGLLWEIAPEDAAAVGAAVAWELAGEPLRAVVRAAKREWDRLLRELGYCRATIGGRRRWLHETTYWALPVRGYRQTGGERKRAARLKVTSERRREIARMGGLARARRKEAKC